MPPSCRANDGTEIVEGRYDHRMEQWVPLLVAIVGAVAAIGVSFWNSRGESAELRQLKAMNEAMAGMPTTAPQTRALAAARDDLAVRVAARVTTAPSRRRLGWVITGSVAALAIIIAAGALILPLVGDTSSAWLGWFALGTSLLTVVAGAFSIRLNTVKRAERAHEETMAILDAMNQRNNERHSR